MSVAASLVLVVCSLATALALGAVTMSLAPASGDPGHAARGRSPMALARGGEWDVRPRESAADPAQPAALPVNPVDEYHPDERPRVTAPDLWVSPLYPRNGVTLWDRIRVSTPGDDRAYLMGIAIQLHAPAIAATPGPGITRFP